MPSNNSSARKKERAERAKQRKERREARSALDHLATLHSRVGPDGVTKERARIIGLS